jgi:hypothetical protein
MAKFYCSYFQAFDIAFFLKRLRFASSSHLMSADKLPLDRIANMYLIDRQHLNLTLKENTRLIRLGKKLAAYTSRQLLI